MKRIIVTVGPKLLHGEQLQGIHQPELLYRINGAHAGPKQAEDFIEKIRAQVPDAEILVDLPGNKIRTASLPAPIAVHKGGLSALCRAPPPWPVSLGKRRHPPFHGRAGRERQDCFSLPL
jgi:pyruvate kinase